MQKVMETDGNFSYNLSPFLERRCNNTGIYCLFGAVITIKSYYSQRMYFVFNNSNSRRIINEEKIEKQKRQYTY